MTTTAAPAHLHEPEVDSHTHLVRLRDDASLAVRNLHSLIAAAGAGGRITVIVDLSEATKVTSRVAWELGCAHARLSWRGGQLVVVADAARLTPLFDGFSLQRAPCIVPTFAAALAAANPSAPAAPESEVLPEPRTGNGGPRFSWRRHDVLPETWSFELAGGPQAPRLARAAVQRLVRRRLDYEAEHAALLLVNEAVTNSVLHGGADANAAVRLTVSVTTTDVHIEVADPVGGFDPPEYPAVRLGEQGRGLPLIHSLSRAWGIEAAPGGCVWFDLPRRASPRRSPLSDSPAPPAAQGRMLGRAGALGHA